MVRKGIRGGICYAILGYAEKNDKNKKSNLKYLDINSFYGYGMF